MTTPQPHSTDKELDFYKLEQMLIDSGITNLEQRSNILNYISKTTEADSKKHELQAKIDTIRELKNYRDYTGKKYITDWMLDDELGKAKQELENL